MNGFRIIYNLLLFVVKNKMQTQMQTQMQEHQENMEGYDNRFIETKNNKVSLSKIISNNKKFDLLTLLQNQHIHYLEKMQKLEMLREKSYNMDLSAGGLFDDWNLQHL